MADDLFTRVRAKFRLDKQNGWIFGVCGGLANCLHMDPAFVRVGVAVSGLFFPKLVIAMYLVVWLVLNDRSILKSRA